MCFTKTLIGRRTYTFAFLPLDFKSCHHAILNFNEIHLFLLLSPLEVMLNKGSASIVVAFDTFCNQEVFPHMTKFLRGSERYRSHISYHSLNIKRFTEKAPEIL